MKSGRLTAVIEIQRVSGSAVAEDGSVQKTWAKLCTLRAERSDQVAVETIEGFGAGDTETVVFRARFFEGVTNADQLIWGGTPWNIRRVAPIGRRKGIELHCEQVMP